MKAIVQRSYGFKNLKVRELPVPSLSENEVLVRVKASCINFANMLMVKGFFPVRLAKGGIFFPKYPVPGGELSGIVEEVGSNVSRFKPGDEVYGDNCRYNYGSFAEFFCVNQEAIAPKPANLSFIEAAAVPQAALVALQALQAGEIKSGASVLIYGASGGIGTFAVQIAKSYGAKVTAVCSGRNAEMVRSLGADHIIDYTCDNFLASAQKYDLILTIRGARPLSDFYQVLNDKGIYVMAGGSWSLIYQSAAKGPRIFNDGNHKMGKFTYSPGYDNLLSLNSLIESGKIKPVIDSVFPFEKSSEAFSYFAKGHAKGKVIVQINS